MKDGIYILLLVALLLVLQWATVNLKVDLNGKSLDSEHKTTKRLKTLCYWIAVIIACLAGKYL